MEKQVPIEELADGRLALMATAYTMLIKSLMEHGVARETVQRASDQVWAQMGEQAGRLMKSLFAGEPTDVVAQKSGAITMEMHGMVFRRWMLEGGHRTEVQRCPWHDAAEQLALPASWRMCASGHIAFTDAMYKVLNPEIVVLPEKEMPRGDTVCTEVIRYGL